MGCLRIILVMFVLIGVLAGCPSTNTGSQGNNGDVENTSALCSDQIDNDADGWTDCDDDDCVAFSICTDDESVEDTDALCSNGLDDDGDGLADCDDDDCYLGAGVTVCSIVEDTNALCSDGLDNDSDGLTDCNDDDCYLDTGVTVCGGGGMCGDATCDASETTISCPADCPVAPAVLMDFSNYTDTAELLADCTNWNCVEQTNTGRILLDDTVFVPGTTKSMRYNFFHGGNGCNTMTIKRTLPIGQSVQEYGQSLTFNGVTTLKRPTVPAIPMTTRLSSEIPNTI